MKIEEVYEILQKVFDDMSVIRGNLEYDISSEAAFRLGEALGAVYMVKTLILTDIIGKRNEERSKNTSHQAGTNVLGDT